TWPEVWSQMRSGDLEIQYDSVLTSPEHPTPVGGLAKIAGEAVRIDPKVPVLAGHFERVELTPTTIAQLASVGLPEALVASVTKYPKTYRIAETQLTTGDYVRGYQEASQLDPQATFTLIPMSQE